MTALIIVGYEPPTMWLQPPYAATPAASWASLTPREREVALVLAVGMSRSLIAIKLGCTARTIDSHRTKVLNKLGLANTVMLARWTLRHGYVTLEEP